MPQELKTIIRCERRNAHASHVFTMEQIIRINNALLAFRETPYFTLELERESRDAVDQLATLVYLMAPQPWEHQL